MDLSYSQISTLIGLLNDKIDDVLYEIEEEPNSTILPAYLEKLQAIRKKLRESLEQK